jgi:Domain of unknown function (DUF4418)
MKKLMVITALVSGLLLLMIPRYILPACEYLGHPAMHCSDTARAEYFVGALFIMLGGATAFLRSRKADLICAAGSIVLSIAAFLLPEKIGYCHSTQMPCNYGMVPGVRFVAVVSASIMGIGLIGTVKSYTKKGSS